MAPGERSAASDTGIDSQAPAAVATTAALTLGAGWLLLGPALSPELAALPVRIAAAMSAILVGATAWRAARRTRSASKRAARCARDVFAAGTVLSLVLAVLPAFASGSASGTIAAVAIGVALAATVATGAAAMATSGDGEIAEAPRSAARWLVPTALLAGLAALLVTGAAASAAGSGFSTEEWLLGAAALLPAALGAAGAARLARGALAGVAASDLRGAAASTVDAGDEIVRLRAALAQLRRRLASDREVQSAPLPPPAPAEQRQEDFLVIVGEELRAPLEEIGAIAAELVSSGRLTAAQGEDVALIVAGTGELLGLVEMVLSPEQDGPVLRVGPVDLRALAEDVARAQRPVAHAKRVTLAVEADGEAVARGDAQRLRQVLTNLVSNAIKFTPGGRVTIELRRDGEEVDVGVRDEGVGIAEGDLQRLFAPYAQVGGGVMQARGTGLGLLICKQIVEAHGGRISVESEVGRGSTFRVRLPVFRSPAPEEAA